MAYIGSSSSFGDKKVVCIDSNFPLQLKETDSGCIFVIDVDVAASATIVYFLPKASETNVGCTFKFVLDGSPAQIIGIDRHADDDDNIFGCVASGDGGSGSASADSTAQETVNFIADAQKGDAIELTLLGNGTDKWWQLSGFANDAPHITVATS